MKQVVTTTWKPDFDDQMVTANGRPICSVYPGWDQEEYEIILRLIAKAPEMFQTMQVAQFALRCGPNFPVGAATSYRVADKLDRMISEIFGGEGED
jgi:hypothetical protein